jgi:ferredoxin
MMVIQSGSMSNFGLIAAVYTTGFFNRRYDVYNHRRRRRFKMSVIITDDCINCGACEIECPAGAVVPKLKKAAGNPIYINNKMLCESYASYEHFYINPDKCCDCTGYYSQPRCNSVCPVSCCVCEQDFCDAPGAIIKIRTRPMLRNVVCLN